MQKHPKTNPALHGKGDSINISADEKPLACHQIANTMTRDLTRPRKPQARHTCGNYC